jgi:cephalosporin hydroxylase
MNVYVQSERAKRFSAKEVAMHATGRTTGSDLLLTLPILRLMNTIEGWLQEDEADLLLAVSHKALIELPQPYAIVEVGSYCGRSTVVLASVVKAICPDAKVYAIDPHEGKVGAQDTGISDMQPTKEKFQQNIANAGFTSFVEIIPQYSFEVTWEKPICLLLVDGLHDYTNVSRDFFHFEPWLVPGAYIAFHDYADYFPGVKTFVGEILASGRYQQVHCAASLMIVQKWDV